MRSTQEILFLILNTAHFHTEIGGEPVGLTTNASSNLQKS